MLQAALMAFDKMSSSLFLHQNHPQTHSVKVFNKAKTLNPKTTTGISMT